MEIALEKWYCKTMKCFVSSHWLKIELVLVFGILPAVISVIKPRGFTVIIIWIVSAITWRALKPHGYRWRKEWNFAALNKASMTTIFKRFVPNAIATLIFTWILIPEHLFSLPLEHPLMWLMVMTLYPLLSVIPQEIIFRSFFLKRYAPIIPDHRMRLVNAAAFGWVHILMQNWIAIVFSAIGGWMFSDTYKKNKSLAAASFEHALYGCFIFTVGLGMYFYHGHVK